MSATIEINKENPKRYVANYQKVVGGNLIELEGDLTPYNDGRGEKFEFEVYYFSDSESEKHYDENWESIKKEILNFL